MIRELVNDKQIALTNLSQDKKLLQEQLKNALLKVRRIRSQIDIINKEEDMIKYDTT